MTGRGKSLGARLVEELPEKEYALFRLGLAVFQSIRLADIDRTDEDVAYVQTLTRYLRRVATPKDHARFGRWFRRGGVLALWDE
jgi:hypothetical protein